MSHSGTLPTVENAKGLRVAVFGLRGIPATWGGVERQCEELYSRLARQGFDIRLYARSTYITENITYYKGVRIVRLGTFNTKHLEAFTHSFLAALDLALRKADVVHIYSQGPALMAPLVRLTKPRARIFFTCGGLDWQRQKWSRFARLILRMGEWCSARCTDVPIMVSKYLQHYYQKNYHVESLYIPNGVNIPLQPPAEGVERFGLTPGGYFCFVGRLVPEKRIEDLILAQQQSNRKNALAIVGDAAASADYVRHLKGMCSPEDKIIFTGYCYGESLAALYANARAYVTASGLEGLPLTLLEAMSWGLSCLASNIEQHQEPLAGTGRYFNVGNVRQLAALMNDISETDMDTLRESGESCRQRVRLHFSWDAAAEQLANAYVRACGKTISGAPS